MPDPTATRRPSMPDTGTSLSDLDLVGIANTLARATGKPVAPGDLAVLSVAPALRPGLGTDRFVVAVRVFGCAYALNGSESGWSVLDAEDVDRRIAAIERGLHLLRSVHRAAFNEPVTEAPRRIPEDVQRWVSPVAGWHNEAPPGNDLLHAAVGVIVEATRPHAVYLIGSLARGDARPDSDIDLFVAIDDGARPEPVVLQRLRQNLREYGVLFDVRGCPRSAFDANQAEPGTIAYAAAREGVLLYGADDWRALRPGTCGRVGATAADVASLIRLMQEATRDIEDPPWLVDGTLHHRLLPNRVHGLAA